MQTSTNIRPAAQSIIPSRHGVQRKQARKMLGALRHLIPDIEPSEERWQQMGESLMQGDAPMDELVEWMFDVGMAKTKPLYEQALERGVHSIPNAPAELVAFFEPLERYPDWVDKEQMKLGARVFQRAGLDLIYIARDVALVGGYQASAFNQTLLLTGALKKGPARRFAETLRWSLDCTIDGGMDIYGPGYRSTLRVRLIHGMVRRHVSQRPDWKMQDWGLPINQTDMASTLLGALTVPLLGSQLLGVPLSRRERDAATQHGRYTGWLMGVEEQWLAASDREALVLLYQLLLSIYNPDETSAQLASPMLEEPFQRAWSNLPKLRARLANERHLSISTVFLGRHGMRNLGLPARVIPWYPMLALPKNLARQVSSRVLPGGLERQAKRGRAEQEAFLHSLTESDKPAVVGEAASNLEAAC